MINLIISKSPKENSQYIYKQIEKDLKAKQKSFLIVPEQYTLQSDINLIDNIDFTTIMDAKVLSFSSLSSFILDRTGGLSDELLSKSGKVMLISNILADLNDQLKLFKNKHQNTDFINDIESLISNIKDNKFDEDFYKTIQHNLDDGVMKLKFEEAKLIYETYQKRIEGNLIDSEDRLSQVTEKLKEADFLRGANFYFDKFDYISDIKLEFLAELNKLGAYITVALTLDKKFLKNELGRDTEIYNMAYKFYRSLAEIDQIKETDLDQKNNQAPDIKHLIENFDKYNPNKYESIPTNINVLESSSTRSEVENTALIINKLIKGKKLRYKDIALYITDLDEYENEIKKIFNRSAIPVFFNKTKKLADNHLVKTYFALLRLVIYGFNKHDLNYFIRSNLFDFGENSLEKVITFQNYISSRNIKGSMFLDDKYFAMDRDFYQNLYENDPKGDGKFADKEKEFELINDMRAKILELIGPLLEISKENHPISTLIEKIYQVISNEGFIRGISNYQNILLESDDLESFEENDQVWDKFIGILEEIVAIMGDRENFLAAIYDIVFAVSHDIEIGIIPPTKDHIIVTSFASPRIPSRPLSFALGLNDTFFPSKSNTEFVFGKEDKDKLKALGLDLKIYEEDNDEREKLNLYKMFTESSQIYLSFALANREGAGINKSLVLNNILNIFPKLKITDLTSLTKEDLVYSEALSRDFALDRLWKIRKGQSLDKKDEIFSKTYINFTRDFGDYKRLMAGLYYSNDKNNIRLDTARELFPKNHFNISQIESYSKCPYRHFVNYGLGPDIGENYDVDHRELGTIVHNSLEDVTRLIKDTDLENITSEDIDQLLAENFNSSVEKMMDSARRSDPRNKFILDNIIKNTKNSSKEIISQLQAGDFKVADVEVDFGYGKEGDLPAVFVDDENYLRGRIDRIDRAGDFIRIIDYKTGNKTFKLVNVLNGLDLQLLVYMMSASADNSEITPIGSFYMPLADELQRLSETYDKSVIDQLAKDKFKMNGLLVKVSDQVLRLIDKNFDDFKDIGVIDRKNTDILTIEENEQIEKFAKDLVSTYIKEIKIGNIKLNPIRYNSSQNECQYCDFKGICKFDESIDQDKYRDFDKSKNLTDLMAERGDDNE